MLQVCDGKTLWDYQQVLESQSYRKIDDRPILEKLKSPELDDDDPRAGHHQLGFAGPDVLLTGLRKAIHFDQKDVGDARRQGRLGPPRRLEEPRGADSARTSSPSPPTAPLPAYVPSLVTSTRQGGRLALQGPARRPAARRSCSTPAGSAPTAGRSAPRARSRRSSRATIELTYANVKLNPDLSADEFVFTAPSNARVDDQTQAILGMLDQTIQIRAAQKKAEAAKAEDPLLNSRSPSPAPTIPAPPPPRRSTRSSRPRRRGK